MKLTYIYIEIKWNLQELRERVPLSLLHQGVSFVAPPTERGWVPAGPRSMPDQQQILEHFRAALPETTDLTDGQVGILSCFLLVALDDGEDEDIDQELAGEIPAKSLGHGAEWRAKSSVPSMSSAVAGAYLVTWVLRGACAPWWPQHQMRVARLWIVGSGRASQRSCVAVLGDSYRGWPVGWAFAPICYGKFQMHKRIKT